MKHLTIALDGPSGAGKSTSAKALAEELSIAYLDTGAMYRALALAFIDDGLNPADNHLVEQNLDRYTVEIQFDERGQRSMVNGIDYTDRLPTTEAGMGASDISQHPQVREVLVKKQREIAEKTSFVLDGRDIGTVVLPDATVKFFLTASPEARARRRLVDLHIKGEDIAFEQVLSDILKRDKQDAERKTSPLKQAEDAILIDSTNLNFDETINKMMDVIEDILNHNEQNTY